MDPSCEVKNKHREGADTGGEPQEDPTVYFWYKSAGDIRNGYRLITAT